MKRSHVVLLVTATSLGLWLVLLSTIAGRSDPTLAAPRLDYAFGGLLKDADVFSYQSSITCTLATTTTDSLGTYNGDPDHAAPVANYSDLALATGTKGEKIPPAEDWFRLDNAQPGSTYGVEAVPDKTDNYNLGIIVYDASLTPIITDTSTSDFRAEITLKADGYGPYFFKVFQITPQCEGETYDLDFSVTPPTLTPTNTPPSVTEEDNYEQNDSLAEAYPLPVEMSVTLSELAGVANFYPADDPDWFKFWAKSGKWYRATTSGLSGVDTFVEIRDKYDVGVAEDDDGGGGYASQAKWQASYSDYYYIHITNNVDTPGSYNLTVEEVDAPSTEPTSTPGPTPTNPEADRCDKIGAGNHDFDNACVISVNVSEEFNFSPPPYGGPDNDFFKIWVKPGFIFECATSNLDPGVDPNMIMFGGPSWDDAIGGNDDVEPGDYNSALSYYAAYEGWLYVLVGTGDRTPTDVYNSDYTLRCDTHTPGQTSTPAPTNTPALTPTPGSQTATPTPTGSPAATPTPAEGLTVRPLTTPTPVVATTPAPRFIPIRLLIYYDANDDYQPGAGEGIAGISAQAYEVATNQLLAQGFTDEQGNLEFTVAAQGPVRVSVPFFGFSQLAAGEGASIYLRIPSQPLPGGAP